MEPNNGRSEHMPCDDWLHCRCYKRRTIFGLALAPLLLAGPARTAEEGEGAKPPAPDDRNGTRPNSSHTRISHADFRLLSNPHHLSLLRTGQKHEAIVRRRAIGRAHV